MLGVRPPQASLSAPCGGVLPSLLTAPGAPILSELRENGGHRAPTAPQNATSPSKTGCAGGRLQGGPATSTSWHSRQSPPTLPRGGL